MPTAEKELAVARLYLQVMLLPGIIVTGYRGLTVAQLRELRTALGRHASFEVVKNTLARIAVQQARRPSLYYHLSGPSAMVFITGDPVHVARTLRDFAKAHPLEVRGGVLDGRDLTVQDIAQLADMQSREVLLARLAGAMKATQANAAATFSAQLAKMAQLMHALEGEK